MKPMYGSMILLVSLVLAVTSCDNKKTDSTTTNDTLTTNNSDTAGSMGNMHDTANMAPVGHAQATLAGTNADTTVTGTLTFDTVANGKVKMVLDITVEKKANSSVAVHLHEMGDCGNKGEMAHGHWNPNGNDHGKWGSANFHAGDIGNIKLDSKGHGKLTVETDLWSLGGDAKKNILNRSVIVHSGVDDYKTQPSGNSGSRIGCGVIQ